jgi:hypothetical protein
MAEQDEGERGFRVTDRRRFSESGEFRNDAPEEPVATPPQPAAPELPNEAEPVNFSTFVLGLSTQALLLLGEMPDPATGQVVRDFPAAKQVIDILGLLRDKTRNNLEQGEDKLFESILYDLRMRYVELVRGGPKEAR